MQRGKVSSEEEEIKVEKDDFGPSLQESARLAKAGLKEGPKAKPKSEAKSSAASSSNRPARRPQFVPEHRPGQADWDPFWQEARGKRSREARIVA